MHAKEFWTEYQPGFRSTAATPGTEEFFAQVDAYRYESEPHIDGFARFGSWAGRNVLEAGCGIGTDGVRFARAGARYTGIDFSPTALELGRRRFELEELDGSFVEGDLTSLPFGDASFDLAYSFGVLHHLEGTERAVDELHRVLVRGGTALVMLYHRDSLNYRFTIMLLRRALVALLWIPAMPALIAKATGERLEVLNAHRELLLRHRRAYLSRDMFLSHNTDGPGNPLSKVFSRDEMGALFSSFSTVRTSVHFLNLRTYPGGRRLASTRLARRLEPRLGWHLCVEAIK
jgi:SAM-dependent methyltransferase